MERNKGGLAGICKTDLSDFYAKKLLKNFTLVISELKQVGIRKGT
jgi:hypothetical protein